MFNDGVAAAFLKVPRQTVGGSLVFDFEPYRRFFYAELGFTVDEYYLVNQAEEVKVLRKIRIRQDKRLSSRHVIEIGGERYNVGRTFSALSHGVPITDVTLERFEG
ncbi:MAG: phage head closure protein [Turicibacter sp.]|nr:phage head closure protein [Turicibacter sp.]